MVLALLCSQAGWKTATTTEARWLSVRGRARQWALPLLVSFIVLDDAPAPVWANGEPEKVVEGRYVVSLALAPDAGAMTFRFSFRHLQTGQRLTGPIVYRVRIRENQARAFLFDSRELRTTTGVADVRYRVPRDGFYEIFLEFQPASDPGKVYRPDDWYLWIPANTDRSPSLVWLSLLAGALALVSLGLWRWTAVRRQRARPPMS